ncbi:MAG: ADOP family duplicated permease [Acidobacteriota bacterium]
MSRRSRAESEMAEELRFHMESRAADLERSGLSAEEAARRARLEFGSVEGCKESCREARGFRPFDELRADLRYAARTLRRSPGFAAMAALSLALGIGVNVLMFVSLYHIVLHPFPYPDLARIATVTATRAQSPWERGPVAPADYLDFAQANRSFETLAAYRGWDANLTGVSRPDHVQGALASAEFFAVLGMRPLRGRVFSAAECEPGKDAVVVVSYGFWRTRLGARPGAVGETLSLGGRKHTVIGVMPEEFNLPLSSELWAPLALTPAERNERAGRTLMAIGKLKPGVPAAQAGKDLDAIARALEQRYPRTNEDRRVLVASMRDSMRTESSRFVLVLMGAALFVLLLACSNVGSLQIARALGRQREFGLRSALGANRFRIVRQLLTEGLVLGAAGGALGLVLAAWAAQLQRASLPAIAFRYVPGLRDVRINGEAILLAVALSFAASMLCCLPAIFQAMRQADVSGVLNEGERSVGASPARNRLRTALVVTEVALAFVLLAGAGLMVGTFQRMLAVNLGYDPHGVLKGDIALDGEQYRDPARMAGFCDAVLRNLNGLPEVRAAAASGGLGPAAEVSIEGRAQPRPGEINPEIFAVTPRFLETMRIPLAAGRWISERDGPEAARVVVLSASVANRYWPSSSPIGRRVKLGGPDSPWLTVAGVAGDVNEWFNGKPRPAAYVAYRQFPQASMRIVVRGAHDPGNLAGVLRAETQAAGREQPVYNLQTIEQQIYDETSGVRHAASMMTLYAAIALLLAVTGIYSISAYFVAQRTREIGLRMSLGATQQGILTMVLSHSCAMSGIGLAIGLPLAIMLASGMAHTLNDVVTVQPAVFVLVTAVLGGLAVLAGYIPAHRAARVDPMIALRHE